MPEVTKESGSMCDWEIIMKGHVNGKNPDDFTTVELYSLRNRKVIILITLIFGTKND